MENLTGGPPPVRYLLCVVPCKLYFIIVEIIFAAGFTFFGIAAILDNDMVFGEKVLFVCFMLVLDPMCIFLCYVINKIFNVEPVKYLYKYLNNIQKK